MKKSLIDLVNQESSNKLTDQNEGVPTENVSSEKVSFKESLNGKSGVEIFDLLMKLEYLKPYVDLARNDKEVVDFVRLNSGLNIRTKKEFIEFYNYLNSQITKPFEYRNNPDLIEYLKQKQAFKEIPGIFSRIENVFDKNLEEFKRPLKETLEVLCNCLRGRDFYMNSKELLIESTDYSPIGGEIWILNNRFQIKINNLKGDKFYIFWGGLEDDLYTPPNFLGQFIFRRIKNEDISSYSAGDFVDWAKKIMIKGGYKKREKIYNSLKKILESPRILKEYLEGEEINVNKLFSENESSSEE